MIHIIFIVYTKASSVWMRTGWFKYRRIVEWTGVWIADLQLVDGRLDSAVAGIVIVDELKPYEFH